jgi:hypothetical protein
MNQVIALTPTELAPAQQSLRAWCEARIVHWTGKQEIARKAVDHAIAHGWKADRYNAELRRCASRVRFYRKVDRAIELGYLIVPNFPLEIFAVRTNAQSPRAQFSTSSWKDFAQKPRILPEGEGRYISNRPTKDWLAKTTDEKGNVTQKEYFPVSLLEDIEMPFDLVRPEIMQAVDRARGLKLFDQVGVCSDRRADPIVCGQILESSSFGAKTVTFFLAWYVDLDKL